MNLCITGKLAENLPIYAKANEKAIDLAVSENYKQKNINVLKFYYDNKPLEPLRAYNAMVNSNCDVIIGYEYLSDLLLIIKTRKEYKPIFSSYATFKDQELIPKNIFIFMPSYDFLVSTMMRYLEKKYHKIDKVLIVTDISREDMLRYKEVYTNYLQKRATQIKFFDFVENESNILKSILLIKEKGPYNFIILLCGGVPSAKLANYLYNSKTIFIGTENFGSTVSQTFYLQLKKKNIKAFFIRNLDFIMNKQELNNYYEKFRKIYKFEPTILSAYTYDAAKIAVQTYNDNVRIDGDAILKNNYKGITGINIKDGKFNRSNDFVILSLNKNGYSYEE